MPRGGLIQNSAPHYTFIGAKSSEVSGSTVTLALLDMPGIAPNDLVIIAAPSTSGGIGSSGLGVSLTAENAEWHQYIAQWPVYGYSTTMFWRRISSPSNVYSTNSQAQSYGLHCGVWRGPTSAALVVEHYETDPGDHDMAFPSKDATCFGLAAFFSDRDAINANMNAPDGWADRYHFPSPSHFSMDILDNLTPPGGGHTDIFTGRGGATMQAGLGFELRG